MSVKCRKSNNYDVEFIEVIENINCHAQSFHFINGFENLPELKFKGLGHGIKLFHFPANDRVAHFLFWQNDCSIRTKIDILLNFTESKSKLTRNP